MALVIAGVVMLLLRWADVGPFGQWSWWAMLSPFGLALLWWYGSDLTGRTRRLQEARFTERRARRRKRATDMLGLDEVARKSRADAKLGAKSGKLDKPDGPGRRQR